MSRVGKRIINIPDGVEIKIIDNNINVKGPLGILTHFFHTNNTEVKIQNNTAIVERKDESKVSKQLHGTTNAILSNMVLGVSKGFTKELEINGVGYKVNLVGDKLKLSLGFSHPVELDVPENLKAEVKANNIKIFGIDKVAVGQFAANIKKIRKPNPYSGKGIIYKGEQIRRKEGKTASK